MKIYTRGGDQGQTSLLGGARKSKSNIRIQAYGAIDELNAHVGLLADQEINIHRIDFLRGVQNVLFTIGAYLASAPDFDKAKLPPFDADVVKEMERAIDTMESQLPDIKFFLLPGGHQSVSFCHIARCVCRRAERQVVALDHSEGVEQWILVYLNRLSDYLYMLSRMMAHELAVVEIPWKAGS